jgi:hypothetical protein
VEVMSHFAIIEVATVGENIPVVLQESRHSDTGGSGDRSVCIVGLYYDDSATILAPQTQAEVLNKKQARNHAR